MVSQGVVNYLQEGVKRGFSVGLLKQKLLENGFGEQEINEGIVFLGLDKQSAPTNQPQPQLTPEQVAAQEKLKKEQAIRKKKNAEVAGKGLNSKEGTVRKQTPWMKIGMFCGYILFGLLLIILIASLFTDIFPAGPGDLVGVAGGAPLSPTEYSSTSLIFFLVGSIIILVLIFFYYFGFTRFGKAIPSRILSFSSWSLIILSVLLIVLMIILTVYIFQIFSDPSNFGDVQNVIENVFTFLKILFIVYLVTSIFTLIFGIGLMRAKQVKSAMLAGIFFLVVSILSLISSGTYSYVLLNPDSLFNPSFLLDIVSNIIFTKTIMLIGLAGVLFGAFSLKSASRQYEN